MTKNKQGEQVQHRESNSELDIARQWIDYLKRRISTLNILVITFLVAALLLATSSVLLYLNILELEKATLTARSNAQQMEQKLNSMSERFQTLNERNQMLEKDLEEKTTRLDQLQSFKGETDSQLNLTTRLVDALKQKVASLEKEVSLLEQALVDSETKVNSLSKENRSQQKLLEEQKNMLGSRKSAYDALVKRHKETQEEMRRLADELYKAQEREQDLDRRNETLLKELQAAQEELKKLRGENLELSGRLKLLTTPIVPSATPKADPVPPAPISPTQENSLPTAPSMQDASTTEESAKGKAKVPLGGSSPLDFDSIAIE